MKYRNIAPNGWTGSVWINTQNEENKWSKGSKEWMNDYLLLILENLI